MGAVRSAAGNQVFTGLCNWGDCRYCQRRSDTFGSFEANHLAQLRDFPGTHTESRK